MSSKLLINNTLNVKGAILTVNDWIAINAHNRRAHVQEYVFENAKDGITEEDALKIADRAIEIMDKSNYTEDDAINTAREQLGYKKAFFN